LLFFSSCFHKDNDVDAIDVGLSGIWLTNCYVWTDFFDEPIYAMSEITISPLLIISKETYSIDSSCSPIDVEEKITTWKYEIKDRIVTSEGIEAKKIDLNRELDGEKIEDYTLISIIDSKLYFGDMESVLSNKEILEIENIEDFSEIDESRTIQLIEKYKYPTKLDFSIYGTKQ